MVECWNAECERLKREYELLKHAVNDNDGECSPECDSYGHTDDCQHISMDASLRIQQEKIDSLAAELSRLRALVPTAEQAQSILYRLEILDRLEPQVSATDDPFTSAVAALRRTANGEIEK